MKIILFLILCIYTSEGFRVRRQLISRKFGFENLGGKISPSKNVVEPHDEEIDEGFKKLVAGIGAEKSDSPPIVEQCFIKNRVCVPFTQCNNGKIITDGFGILTTRSGAQIHQHSQCPLFLEVCCQEPDIVVHGQDSGFTDHFTSHTNIAPKCGQRNYEGIGANVGRLNESFSQFAEFPWMSAILKKESIPGKELKLYLCGGSLISENVILTAAHCVSNFKAENIFVRVGEWDTQQRYEPFEYQERQALKIIEHPLFSPNTLYYDFSLIILKKPFIYASHIAPICLPDANDSFVGQVCHATGWGKELFGEKGTYQNVLKNVDLEVVSHPNCERALKETRLGQYFELHSTFTCAGGKPGKDTCRGDGGSPLVCRKAHASGSSYIQAGIVAWGIGCGEEGVPGVYADVRQAVEWIKSEMAPFEN